MKTPGKKHIPVALSLAIAAISVAAGASAQQLQLEEVIVTAQKRTQGLQDVPIAVTAISGDKIVQAGILNLEDLTTYVPNVNIIQNPGGGSPTEITVRGIGSGNNTGFEQSVGMFIDGVYSGRSRQYLVPFLDVASVEVLKGPQGTLFGKSTVGGAMIVNSARPTDTFEAELRARYEFEYESTEYTGIVSGPLTDTFSGRLAATYQDIDGYMDNLVRGTEEPEVENTAIRGSLQWDASDAVEVYAKLEYAEQETTGANAQVTSAAGNFRGLVDHTELLSPLEDARFDDKRTADSFKEESSDTDTLNAAIKIEWELANGVVLSSLTGYSDYDSESILDGDFTDIHMFETPNAEDFEQISQEFLVNASVGDSIDLLAGVYIESQELNAALPVDISLFPVEEYLPIPAVAMSMHRNFEQDADTLSGFGQLTWQFADDWSLTAGGRYTDEEKDASLEQWASEFGETEITDDFFINLVVDSLLMQTSGKMDDDRTTSYWSYSANLSWDYSDDGMAYVRVAKGNKSGGFNPNNATLDPAVFDFDDEEVESIEFGVKTAFLDGAATVNLAAFYTEMTDLQVSSFSDSGFVVGNAAESTSKGFELDGRWMAAQWLNFSASVGYLDSEYDDFPGAPCTAAQLAADDPVAVGCDGWTAADPGAGTTNLEGQVAGRAPEWTATFITNVFFPVGESMIFKGTVDFLYEDELYGDEDLKDLEPNYQDSYHKINARLALASVDDTWEVALIGKNLNDETTYANGAGIGFFSGSWMKSRMAPRTYALDLIYRFQ